MTFKITSLPKLSFWVQWFLHAFVVWLVLNLADAADFIYRTSLSGTYLKHYNGTPVTLWERFLNHNIHQAQGIVILVITLLVEANYHYVFRKQKIRIFVITTLVTGGTSLIFILTFNYWMYQSTYIRPISIYPVLIIAAYAFVYALIRDFFYRQVRQAEQRYEQSKSELSALRAQLHPHFFFNTLNTIYGTAMEENASQTADSIIRLSGLLRYVMSEQNEDFTSVTAEFAFLENYLELQQCRIPKRDNIDIQTRLHYDQIPARIAPLLLIPFAENAFKYGMSIDRDCYINISVVVENRKLTMRIENLLLPLPNTEKGQGTGIENVKRRLSLLYPDRHQLTIQKQEHLYKVYLQIDLS